MADMPNEVQKILEPVFKIFDKESYHKVKTPHLRHAFVSSLVMNSTDMEMVFAHYIDAGKLMTDVKGGVHLVTIVILENDKLLDNYYIVGTRTTEDEISSGSAPMCPPVIKLKDFLERVGDQTLPEYFDSLPRDRAVYSKIKPVMAMPT